MKYQKYISDILFHFVGRNAGKPEDQFEILKKILLSKKLLFDPAGNMSSSVKPFDLNSFKIQGEISKIPAICFCDIPIESIGLHINKYSSFGIGFKKQDILKYGVRPVWYVPKDSYSSISNLEIMEERFPLEFLKLEKSLSVIIDKLEEGTGIISDSNILSNDPNVQKSLENLHQSYFFILAEMCWFFKFYNSKLPEDHVENYYFEREWRKVNGNIDFKLSDIEKIVVPSMEYKKRLIKILPELTEFIYVI